MTTNNIDIYKALAVGTIADLVDLNDWAVNVVRDYCCEMGYYAYKLVAEEKARIDAKGMDLETYLRASRAGSTMRLKRSVRRAVWTALATRKALVEKDTRVEAQPRLIDFQQADGQIVKRMMRPILDSQGNWTAWVPA